MKDKIEQPNLNIEQYKDLKPIPFLNVVHGDGGTKGPWIMDIEEGSMFLIKNKKRSEMGELLLITLLHKGNRFVAIEFNKSKEIGHFEPYDFCKENELIEILHRGEIKWE